MSASKEHPESDRNPANAAEHDLVEHAGPAREPAARGAAPSRDAPSAPGEGAPPAERYGRSGAARARSSIAEAFILVLVALMLALTLKSYVAEAYEIKGRSMLPTFHNGERVVVLKTFYEIARGDVIIFTSTEDPAKDLIKRVIGLPGEEVVIESDGRVFVDGKSIEESYLLEAAGSRMGYYGERFRYRVPPDEFYVLGDNRRDSHDSRRFFGVPRENVKGKVVVRWWPLDEIRSF